MPDFLIKIIPIILIFFLGYFLKRIKLFGKETADIFLKFIFYVSMPALVFHSVSQIWLSIKFIYLPFIAFTVFFVIYFITSFIGKKLELSQKTLGTFILGSIIMNTGFSLPFIFSAFGEKGVATVAIFDFGNALLVLTFGYYIAMKYGKAENTKINYQKLFFLPPIWGLIFGLLFNLIKIPVPTIANNFLNQIGMLTIPLIMLSIGIYFSPRIKNLSRLLIVLFIRTGIGLLLGFVFASILNLQGVIKTIVIICSGAPVGYNTLVFSTLENLDKEFAANLVSVSILTGIVYIPVLIILF
ncbi:MAG TPA: AEC family transporter [Candidatus Cloacimonetes bacterium]|nr:AEC family transporter [Candidatus Cloacimonadota bacterium]